MRALQLVAIGLTLSPPMLAHAGECLGDPEVTYCPAVVPNRFVPNSGRIMLSADASLSNDPTQTRFYYVEMHWAADTNLAH
jgi:hypothetical protein